MADSVEACCFRYFVAGLDEYKCDAPHKLGFVPSEAILINGSNKKKPQYHCGTGYEWGLGNQEICMGRIKIREAMGKLGYLE